MKYIHVLTQMTTGCGSLVTDFPNKPQALPGYQTKQRMYNWLQWAKLLLWMRTLIQQSKAAFSKLSSTSGVEILHWTNGCTDKKKWKETIQWFSPSVLKSSYSLFLSSADSPAHPQSVGCFTLFLSVEWKKKKTNPLPPVGQRPAVFQGFV